MFTRFTNFLRSPQFPIFMIIFVDTLGAGITIPVLPLYAQSEFSATPLQITFTASIYFIAQFFASPQLGKASDKWGRRPILILSQAGTFLAFLISAAAPGLGFLYLARAIDGITGGNISVAQAYLSDITDEKNRAEGMGIVNAAFGAGFLFGPAFGAFMAATFGPRSAYFAAAIVCVIMIALSIFLLPESLTKTRRQQDDDLRASQIQPKGGRLGLLRLPSIALLMGIAFLGQLAFFAFQTTYVLWFEKVLYVGVDRALIDRLGGVQGLVGGVLTYIGVVGIVTQFWLVRPLVRRFGEKAMVAGGLFSRVIAWGAIPIFQQLNATLVVTPLISFGGGISQPAAMALLTYAAPPGQRGHTIGLAEAVQGIGRIAGPLLGGLLFEKFSPNAPMYFAATVTLVAVILCLPLWRMNFTPSASLIQKRDTN